MIKSFHSFTERGGWWVMVQSLLMLATITLGVLFRGEWSGFWSLAFGSTSVILGGYVGIAGVSALGRNRTAYPDPVAASELVERGIYAHVRHPLYASVMLVCFGWAACWRSVPSLSAALATTVFLNAKATREERGLLAKFNGYTVYAQRVPRFIPRIRPVSAIGL